jgi:nucleotide-binding universal stress UspA family protein
MEEAFNNILVPVDGSQQSRTAQEMAIFLSKLFKSQVTLLNVVSNELPTLAGQMYSSREDFVPINPATFQFPRRSYSRSNRRLQGKGTNHTHRKRQQIHPTRHKNKAKTR